MKNVSSAVTRVELEHDSPALRRPCHVNSILPTWSTNGKGIGEVNVLQKDRQIKYAMLYKLSPNPKEKRN